MKRQSRSLSASEYLSWGAGVWLGAQVEPLVVFVSAVSEWYLPHIPLIGMAVSKTGSCHDFV